MARRLKGAGAVEQAAPASRLRVRSLPLEQLVGSRNAANPRVMPDEQAAALRRSIE